VLAGTVRRISFIASTLSDEAQRRAA
jgi:hypothetical protein